MFQAFFGAILVIATSNGASGECPSMSDLPVMSDDEHFLCGGNVFLSPLYQNVIQIEIFYSDVQRPRIRLWR